MWPGAGGVGGGGTGGASYGCSNGANGSNAVGFGNGGGGAACTNALAQWGGSGSAGYVSVYVSAPGAGSLEWPPVGLSGGVYSGNNLVYTQTVPGSGTYVISASSSWNGLQTLSAPFNGLDSGTWNGNTGAYTVSTMDSGNAVYAYSGTGVSTMVSGVTVYGDWLQIQLPQPVQLTSYSLQGRADRTFQLPYRFYVTGSNDGATWTQARCVPLSNAHFHASVPASRHPHSARCVRAG